MESSVQRVRMTWHSLWQLDFDVYMYMNSIVMGYSSGLRSELQPLRQDVQNEMNRKQSDWNEAYEIKQGGD